MDGNIVTVLWFLIKETQIIQDAMFTFRAEKT